MAAFLLLACGSEPEPGREGAGARADPPDTSSVFQGRVFERTIVFMSGNPEMEVILPWSFVTRTRPGGVERRARGWLARDLSWDPFYSAAWETPPSRAPWRILPRRPLRILVGEGDVLERLVFQEGPRAVELGLGSTLVEWSGQQDASIRIQEGQAFFPERELDGMVLDLVRARGARDPVPGDWAFLLSGDSLQLVVEDPGGGPEARDSTAPTRAPGAYRAWARVDFRDTQWLGVSVTWEGTRAFEEARRDVPVEWSISSGNGELVGRLEVQSAWLEAGEGSGPLLPVTAFYQVRGEVQVQGRTYPVWGLFHHSQS